MRWSGDTRPLLPYSFLKDPEKAFLAAEGGGSRTGFVGALAEWGVMCPHTSTDGRTCIDCRCLLVEFPVRTKKKRKVAV